MKNIFSKNEVLISCSSLRSIDLKTSKLVTEEKANIAIDDKSFLLLSEKLNKLIEKNSFKTAERVKKKFWNGKKTDLNRMIVEVLMARRYRGGTRESSGFDILYQKVSDRTKGNLPIRLTISLFPCKIPNLLKNAGLLPDLADFASLARLKEICLAVKHIYPVGAKFIVLMDGYRFKEILNFPDEIINKYQETLQLFSRHLNLEGCVELVDYTETLDKLLPEETKFEKRKIFLKTRAEYTKMFGENIDLKDPMLGISKILNSAKDKELANKFVALYMSLIYCIYVPEIKSSKNQDNLTLRVFEDIFNFKDSSEKINILRQKIVQDTWNFTINYISEIVSGRLTKPVEYIYPDSIRCDMHNIIDRLTLYPVNRSTKLSSFHGSGYVDKNFDINVGLRIVLTTNGYLPVYGKIFNSDYSNQPFLYLDPTLAKEAKKFDIRFINSLRIK